MHIRISWATVIFVLLSSALIQAQQWTVTEVNNILPKGRRDIVPDAYVIYQVDADNIKEILWQAPHESEVPVSKSFTYLTVGLPDGTADIFRMVRYDMMEPELAAAYPDIRTFRGISVSDSSRYIRVDITEQGMRAVIRDPDGNMYIDHFQRNDHQHRIAYYKKHISSSGDWSCETVEEEEQILDGVSLRQQGDCLFRTYRLAQAANGEYSNFHGAFSASQSGLVMSAIVTVINRVNEVYEADLAIRLVLINNTSALFFYNPATDGYTNDDGVLMLGENITKCNTIIGSSNYDIGHVFSTGGGGVAYLGCLCNSDKAGGVTGGPNPVGDPFSIDYVAHEMGHQFGGSHTFNGTASSCSGNRSSSSAYETGSGTTIQAYAGICGSQNVQSNSDDYFHARSILQIANKVTSSSCAGFITFPNNPPVAVNVPNYTIPISTPFVLTADVTDPDGDPLMYCWEQYDLESTSTEPPASNDIDGPLFRSLPPTSSPSRYFPRLSNLTQNTNYTWEVLPSVTRPMVFRMTVRDYHNIGGCTDEDDVTVNATATAGPFIVTSHNTGGTWSEGSTQTITWNVANTTASPVSCANVRISLSYDGGFTYPAVLLANTPNDGSADIVVPTGTTTQGRIMVSAVGNVFFDINNQHITITPGLPNFTLSLDPALINECNDGTVQTIVTVGSYLGFNNPVNLSLLNAPPGAGITFIPSVVTPGNTSTLTISNLSGLFGSYMPVVRGNSTTGNIDITLPLTLTTPAPAPSTISPGHQEQDVDLRATFSWSTVTNASMYEYQVAENINFTPAILSGTTANTQFIVSTLLTSDKTYYWRVRSQNICGNSAWSAAAEFRTMICQTRNSTDVPKTISSMGTPTINSTLPIDLDEEIIDIQVVNLAGTHGNVDNLRFTLISPAATEVIFWDRPCGNDDHFNIHFDDEAANSNWPCPPTNGLTYKPDNNFNPFNGQNAQGTWTLRVQDLANMNGGSLNSWGIRVCHSKECDLVVTVGSGDGAGSLPNALSCCEEGDTIYLGADMANKTIDIGALPLSVNKNVTIIALGLNTTVTGSGDRVFEVMTGKTVAFQDFRLRGGVSTTGGVLINQGVLTFTNMVVSKNPEISGADLIRNLGGELKLVGNCRME